jgi:G3E family GTPase
MDAALLPLPAATPDAVAESLINAVLRFSAAKGASQGQVSTGQALPVDHGARLAIASGESVYPVTIEQAGAYALFTEHHPDEFRAVLRGPDGALEPALPREYKPDHEHDEAVTSVGITTPGDLDLKRFQEWLRELLMTQGPDIFRMKGVLSFKGEAQRFVFQGVHMLFDGRPDRPWGQEERHNKLIFIGRNLDRAALNEGFRACLA